MAYWVYNLLVSLFFVFSLPALPLAVLFAERFRKGFLQRLAFYPRTVLDSVRGSRPIWIHAVSVGEVLSVRRLVERLRERFPGRKILLSTFTATGHAIARQSAGADEVIFLPLDHPWVVRRAFNVFDPSLLVCLETEIWPNFLRLAHRKGIPTLLLSGRLSPGAFRRYRLLRFFFAEVVRQFTSAGMQSEEDAERMVELGFDPRRLWITGNLKRASLAEPEAAQPTQGLSLPLERNRRPVLVAGSTHRGEEEVLLEAFCALKAAFPNLLMVLAPRHPQRFDEVERLLKRKKVPYGKKSQMNGQGAVPADVIFLDTLGELPDFYSMADIAFIGGSLVDAGGHNPIEPARLRKPVLFGPYMTNFRDVAREMKQKGGGIEVHGQGDLVRELSRLLADPAAAESMGKVAYSIVEGDRGVMERSIDLVSRYLLP